MRCERHGLTPVIVNDLDIVGIALSERKTDTPARVHSHRPLSCSVPLKLVKPNASERTEVLEGLGDIQGQQQVHCQGKIQAAKLVGPFTFPYSAACGMAPRPDHGRNVL